LHKSAAVGIHDPSRDKSTDKKSQISSRRFQSVCPEPQPGGVKIEI
jgi:hypothetical protein